MHYALAQMHKHLPEMKMIVGLDYEPVFEPVVDDYYCGMIYTKESHDGWQLCIFSKHSSREVARF